MDVLKVKKMQPTATIPTRGSLMSAGLDLYLDQEILVIHPGDRKMAHTNISVAIPEGNYGRVAPRSGLAAKNGLMCMAGVIDSDYRGEVCVILYNSDPNKTTILHRGDRIAQLIIEKIDILEPVEVEDLDETDRGSAGFGSTG